MIAEFKHFLSKVGMKNYFENCVIGGTRNTRPNFSKVNHSILFIWEKSIKKLIVK